MPTVAFVSFRLGGRDGVAVETDKWARAFERLAYSVVTVAGDGPVDHLLPGLAIDAPRPPSPAEVRRALSGADLVVVENLCSLPLNPRAAEVVAGVLEGRPAILHHHDLPWQRPRFAGLPPPPDDPAWAHVTINDLSRRQLAEHGIEAVTLYNTFDTEAPPGRRHETRRSLGIAHDDLLFVQPTRALPRKNVAGGLAVASALGATYWLLGPAEDGYGPELERLLGAARGPVLVGPAPGAGGRADVADAYAASDAVLLPSTWEGFGNPAVESAVHRRPLVIGRYPVADELAAFGFRWFAADDPDPLADWLARPDPGLLDHNAAVARSSFSERRLPGALAEVLERLGAPSPVIGQGSRAAGRTPTGGG
ncbi:MAG TPA: hypothetical protein VKG43_00130 [Acidimicrobiales bacterium]|nr:hypothetical protein [Acidimicrobiales bacterium]